MHLIHHSVFYGDPVLLTPRTARVRLVLQYATPSAPRLRISSKNTLDVPLRGCRKSCFSSPVLFLGSVVPFFGLAPFSCLLATRQPSRRSPLRPRTKLADLIMSLLHDREICLWTSVASAIARGMNG
jgi:hypothetical protein